MHSFIKIFRQKDHDHEFRFTLEYDIRYDSLMFRTTSIYSVMIVLIKKVPPFCSLDEIPTFISRFLKFPFP